MILFSRNSLTWSGLAALACLASGAAAVDLDAELGLRFDENLTRAEAAADQEHDRALVLNGRAAQRWRPSPLTSVTAEAGVGVRWWTRFEDVSVLTGDAGLRLKRRLDAGFRAPWAELALSATGLVHNDSDIRDGAIVRAGLTAGRRIGDTVSARLGYGYSIRRAAEDRVFDLEQHDAFGQLDWQLGPRWLLYAELAATEGEITSTAGIPNPRIGRKARVLPRKDDDAFGLGPSPTGTGLSPRWTYQIDGVIASAAAGVNYPLTPGLAVDVSARYVQAWAAGDNQYNGYIVDAGLLWQFR
ncbi:MAG: hypothetical protein ACU85V_03570 [Gammaproteobacteria bacterium]